MSRYDQKQAWGDFRVGLITFVALSFLILGLTFAGGDKGLLFHSTSFVKAWLIDVGGLKKGSSVSMGGMVIGKVADIAFVDPEIQKTFPQPEALSHGPGGSLIEVIMEVRSDVRGRIKADSVPSIRTFGMMGDRYVDISQGSETALPLPDGKPLIGKSAAEFDEAIRQASAVLTETEKLLTAVNKQQGTVGQFFYDEKFYANLTEITSELNDLIKDFKKQPRKYIKFSLF